MIDNIIANNGHINSLAGIAVVFIGLVAIYLAIEIFNKVSFYFRNKNIARGDLEYKVEQVKPNFTGKKIPEDELVAIAVAVEAYRKIHFDILQSEITFTHGNTQTAWKMLTRNRKYVNIVR